MAHQANRTKRATEKFIVGEWSAATGWKNFEISVEGLRFTIVAELAEVGQSRRKRKELRMGKKSLSLWI
jgi:hypothetical protein